MPQVGIVAILLFTGLAPDDVLVQSRLIALLLVTMAFNFVAMISAGPIMRVVGLPVFQSVGWVFAALQAGLATQTIINSMRALNLSLPTRMRTMDGRRDRRRAIAAIVSLVMLLLARGAGAQELEPRAFSPSPVGTSFVLGGIGKSEGGILFDPALDIDSVQADLWVATIGAGHTFALAGRQARILAVLPIAWGSVAGNVNAQAERQDLAGAVDPRFKLSVGLMGAPALTMARFGEARRRTALGAAVTVVPPWGQYNSGQLVNLGYHRWAVKLEIGASRAIGRWTLDGSASVWLFSANRSYFPGRSVKRQDPVVALQGHASYALLRRSWLALNGTWFAGGETRVDDVLNPDLQRNTRVGATLSIPIVGKQSIKFAYSTGTSTRRGTDFNTFNATWQIVMF